MFRREVRASRGQLLLYGSCVALGIAALVGLHGLRSATRSALDAQSQDLLGADLRIASRARIEGPAVAPLEELEASRDVESTRVTRFGSMVMAVGSGLSRMVDVQAVEATYPLYGAVETRPGNQFANLHTSDEPLALVDSSLLIQLDTEIGEYLAVGELRLRIAGTLSKAPGSFGMQTQIAPRVLIPLRDLARTELIRPGSMVEYLVYLKLAPRRQRIWLEEHKSAMEDARLKIQTVSGYRSELNRSFGMMTRYLGLVGLAALALGGVGVAAGIRVFVREKLETVALLRSLGASSVDVIVIYGGLALVLGFIAGLAGACLGTALQWSLPLFMRGLLPVELSGGFDPFAVLTGIVLGIWITLIFSVGPMIDLVRVPPLRALRADFTAEAIPIGGRLAILLALGSSLLGISLWQAPRIAVGLAFAAGMIAALGALAAAAGICTALLRRNPIRIAPYWFRQGVANLFRPRNHTLSTVMTIGFGLFLVSTLHGIQVNVMRQLALDSRPDRPNLVLFDVQPDQVEMLERFLDESGAVISDRAPLISARVAEVRGLPISQLLKEDPENREMRWALQREYRLTYQSELRETETLVSGVWWRDPSVGASPPVPVSVETSIAKSLDLSLGDAMTWDIQGVSVPSVIASIRKVDWGRAATNFFVVFPPGIIEQAPHTSVFLARVADPAQRAALQREIVREFSNVSVLDATAMLAALDTMMGRMTIAIRVLALFTLATGFMILIAATITARRERVEEMRLLRTLGASTGVLRRIVATEAIALGALAALVGSGIACLGSWALVRFVFELPFYPPWSDLAGLAAATLLLSAILGGAGGRRMDAG